MQRRSTGSVSEIRIGASKKQQKSFVLISTLRRNVQQTFAVSAANLVDVVAVRGQRLLKGEVADATSTLQQFDEGMFRILCR